MPPLRVLITNRSLATRSGTELYLRDLALALAARGHRPIVYTPDPGEIAAELTAAGVAVHADLATIGAPPDVIHGHHTAPTVAALRRFPRTPALYVCHDRTFREDTPPRLPRVYRHVAVDDNCRERLVEAGIPAHRIRIVFNAVDLGRFTPRGPLPGAPARALVFSNYASEATHLPAVREACAALRLPLDVIGAAQGRSQAAPERALGRYDLVFAKARCALEALAVGCAVVLCDFRGLGPMVTRAEAAELRRWNFGMRVLGRALEAGLIRGEVERYDARDAAAVSAWVRESAGLGTCVGKLEGLYREVIEEHRAAPVAGRRQEARAAARALREAGGRSPLRAWLGRLPLLGRALVTLKRAVTGSGGPRRR